MSTDVLILNRSFFAVAVTSWQRAVSMLFMDHAVVVDDEYRTYNFRDWIDLSRETRDHPAGYVHTPTLTIALPEVVALRFYDKVPLREVPFTRRNIYHHYGNHCCYCGKKCGSAELNLDHIIPRSRGGGTDWGNIVTACLPCNLRKGNRLPAEAGMKLVRGPSRPKSLPGAAILARSPVSIRRSWQRFIDALYWNSELEQQ